MLGVAIERLEDLDALAEPDGKLADDGARVEVEPEPVAEVGGLALGRARGRCARRRTAAPSRG